MSSAYVRGFAVLVTISGLAAFAVSCGKKDDSSSSASAVTSLISLPDGTGAVGGATLMGATALGDRDVPSAVTTPTPAKTGVPLSGMTDAKWSNKSRAACEFNQALKNMFRDIGQADKMKCIVGAMDKAGAVTGLTGGTEVVFNIGGAQKKDGTTQTAAGKVKVIASKDSSGAITSFKMWTCFNGTTQDNFASITVADGKATIVQGGANTFGTNTGKHRATCTGAIDADGKWTKDKTCTQDGSMTGKMLDGATMSGSHSLKLVQDSANIAISGCRTGTFGAKSHSNFMYSKAAMLSTSDLSKISVGNGCAKYNFNFGDGASGSKTGCWTGDDLSWLVPPTDGEFYTEVDGQTLATTCTALPDFQTGETWDCTPSAGVTAQTVQFAKMSKTDMDACMKKDMGDEAGGVVNCGGGAAQ